MIYITGGAYQGKSAYAREHFPWANIVDRYQDRIRGQLKEGLDPLAEAERLVMEEDTNREDNHGEEGERQVLVIICDEVGCGVVPMDAGERAYREACGRVGCYLAGRADLVYRVVCGIGIPLKG